MVDVVEEDEGLAVPAVDELLAAEAPEADTLVKPEPEVVPTEAAPVDEIMAALRARMSIVEDSSPFFKGLIYGPPGAGKTVFAGSADNCLYYDIERGSESLRNHESSRKTTVLEYKSLTQLELVMEKLAEGAFSEFEVFVIDSGTVLQEMLLDKIVQVEYERDSSKRNPYIPQLQDYNANTNQFRRVARMLRDLPMHTIMIAHAREVKDETKGTMLMRPSFTDKLAVSLNHLFSTIGYLDVNSEGQRTLQVHPSDKITAKTRIGGLPGVITNPDINTLIQANASTKDK